ncbi:uncharacterized protein EAE98_002643 [Botrytis deweyae]|uniref:L-ornithine N(5)-oxygenase n=1 Tax=Botrytis deweyae TaxID=2478750 RepID=A0ABQ7IXS5_9HELO|nr:uncharacterized protein EAE98_002643 [Botrytis deweyae]KAF7936424.1 hypothetical protein EAE98_002643 [Botrytis deweyae]
MSTQTKGNVNPVYGNIVRINHEAHEYIYYPIAIIGAGESGIAMGCRLKEVLGFDQFRIFDRQSGIGGTWWINRYPGVACDIPSTFYSFSFCPKYDWSCFHPGGAEMAEYLQTVCEKYAIVDKIQVNTDAKEARWLENEQVWEVTLQHLMVGAGDLSEEDRALKVKKQGHSAVYTYEEKIRCKILISAVGGLVQPKSWPESIPGKDNFKGEIFHSARWRFDVNLKDKNVVVIGTGCSAAQFVPKLVTKYGAKSVTQLMHSPPWVSPKVIPPLGENLWNKWSPTLNTYVPGFNKAMRYSLGAVLEYDFRIFRSGSFGERERRKLEAECLAYMKSKAPEKYHEILTPNYGIGCKRRIWDPEWYASLNDPKIHLTTLPLKSLEEDTVTLGPGRNYPPENVASSVPTDKITIPADVIVLANGFQTTKWFHPFNVYGKEGKTLQDVFEERGGPQMYMGTAMDGFPNFFTLLGPNCFTGHTSVIYTTESMVTQTLNFIKPLLNGNIAKLEVKQEAQMKWTTQIQSALRSMVWADTRTKNWYLRDDGWNSNTYPYTQLDFFYRCSFPTWRHWNIAYTRKGFLKKWTKRTFVLLVWTVAFIDIYKKRTSGGGLGLNESLNRWFKKGLLVTASTLTKLAKNIQ